MDLTDSINALIAVGAVVISFVALVRTRKNSKKLIELEEIHAKLSKKQLEEYEAKEKESVKANLKVNLLASGSSGKFIVENMGPAKATEIFFSLSDEGGHNPLVKNDFNTKIPFPLLNPGEDYFLLARFPLSVTQMIYDINLSWHNEDGSRGVKTFSVSR